MKHPLLLPLVAVIAFVAGILATSAYRDRLERRDAAQEQLVSALDKVATAQLTLRMLEKKGTDSVVAWSQGTIVQSIGQAHSAVRAGASLHGQAVPNLARAFSQATASLRESGRNPSALTQAEAVLAYLAAEQVPGS